MIHWQKALISLSTSIKDAIQNIDGSGIKIAFVVDENERLLGTVTDGDIRRGILRGISLDSPVNQIMRSNPIVAAEHEDRQNILEIMKQKKIFQIPVLNEDRRIIRVEVLNELIQNQSKKNMVILMAGGLGSRLKPLTDDCPKPLLTVGSKPILEIILESFIEQGFKKFYIAVHYKDEMVRKHFGNGSNWGVEILYLYEEERRGTAGALALLPDVPQHPIIVMNGDLLTKVNFQQFLDFHAEHNAAATMGVREYDFQVPFGVVQLDHHRILNIDEKPVHRFFVNAGIYTFDPSVLSLIPKDTYLDMPNFFEKLSQNKKETAAFPIREYWLDIGQLDDLKRANGEYASIFIK
jgi:dTDP-glucose pyrophosphorylase